MPLSIRLLILWVTLACYSAANDFNLDLEYSVDGSRFSPFGKMSLRQKSDGNYTGNVNTNSGIDNQLLKELKSSAAKNGLYYLRSDDFLTSNSACLMLRSNLKQRIAVSVDQERGAIESLTIFPDGIYDTGIDSFDCSQFTLEGTPSLSVRVDTSAVQELPVPDTMAYLQRLEEDKRARQHGASTDNRSFLAKYWMYIVPVVIFMVVSGAMGGEEAAPAAS